MYRKLMIGAVVVAFVLGGCTTTETQKRAAGDVWSKRVDAQKKEMEQATEGTGVAVTKTEDNRLKLEVPDILFAIDSASINSNFKSILDAFVTTLVKNPDYNIAIIGHADSSGSDEVNKPLSFKRADSVRSYLVDKGVSSTRIATDGRGSRQPFATNDTPANMTLNRRVEIFVWERFI